MCYYYSIPSRAILEKRFKARFNSSIPFSRVYSVSGFSKPQLPVITNKDTNIIQLFNWDLIPHWVKDVKTAKKMSEQNAE